VRPAGLHACHAHAVPRGGQRRVPDTPHPARTRVVAALHAPPKPRGGLLATGLGADRRRGDDPARRAGAAARTSSVPAVEPRAAPASDPRRDCQQQPRRLVALSVRNPARPTAGGSRRDARRRRLQKRREGGQKRRRLRPPPPAVWRVGHAGGYHRNHTQGAADAPALRSGRLADFLGRAGADARRPDADAPAARRD
jgi:hypothetical protein